jgi:hypothetical protein
LRRMSRRTPRRRHGGAYPFHSQTQRKAFLCQSKSGSLKIRILPNAEQKELLKQYAGTARYLHNQAKALAEGVSDRARATAIAGWEPSMTGPAKERSKACNKMKCKTHGEVSGCATQKQADSGKNRCWFVKESHKCGGDVIDPEAMPGSKLRYFCEDHVQVDAFGRRQNHEQPTPRSDGRSCRSLSTQGMRHSALR